MTKTTKTRTAGTADAAVAIFSVTVGDRQAYVRATDGAAAMRKFVDAHFPAGVLGAFGSYENEAGVVETRAAFALSAGRSSWVIYATPISILD